VLAGLERLIVIGSSRALLRAGAFLEEPGLVCEDDRLDEPEDVLLSCGELVQLFRGAGRGCG
jgi:hypothetical protein